MATMDEKKDHDHPFGKLEPPVDGDRENVDTERRGSTMVHGRKLSRIGPAPALLAGDSSDEEYTKLVEMEAENAIKYRTCSWQKVNDPFLNPMWLRRSVLPPRLAHRSWSECTGLSIPMSLKGELLRPNKVRDDVFESTPSFSPSGRSPC